MLVFGCNSAAMILEDSEPHGFVYTMLLNGCPTYVGCLWNVTDVDLDNITKCMLSRDSHIEGLS